MTEEGQSIEEECVKKKGGTMPAAKSGARGKKFGTKL
jgi:hypothetical protein